MLGTTGIDYTSPEERLAAMPQFKLRSQYEAKKIDLADESAMVAIRVQRSMHNALGTLVEKNNSSALGPKS